MADGYAGLLYDDGKLLDTRKSLLQVAGQEVFSADTVGVKLRIVLTTQLADVAKSVQAAMCP